MTKPFKIAVAGSHSTGKTSFLKDLEAALRDLGLNVEYVHDSAADARDLGFPILSGHTFESTAWLMGKAIAFETEASLRAEIILIDRPVHDALGYLEAALEHSGRSEDPARLRTLHGICAAWAGEYDIVLVTEIDETIPVGPGRDDDFEFRRKAANSVRSVIERYFGDRWALLGADSRDRVLCATQARMAPR